MYILKLDPTNLIETMIKEEILMKVLSVIILSLQRESKHEETMYNCDHVSVTNVDRKCKESTMCIDIRYKNLENIH